MAAPEAIIAAARKILLLATYRDFLMAVDKPNLRISSQQSKQFCCSYTALIGLG